MTQCLVDYTIQLIVFIWITFSCLKKKDRDIILMKVALTFLWLFFIYNVTYTGILGWHVHASSALERKLDNINIAGSITSFIMMFHANILHPKVVKEEKKE